MHNPALEAVSGAQGAVVEEQEDRLVGQKMVLDPTSALVFEVERGSNDQINLFFGHIRERDEIAPLERLAKH
jgi:hypothetical protein